MNWAPPIIYLIGIAIVAFLLGSIPFGFLVAKLKGVDIRKHGSGNIGATNVFRTLGKGLGITVFVLDALKGVLAVQIALHSMPDTFWAGAGLSREIAGVVAAIFVILGHNFTPWLGFKGGKGIATSAGVLLGLWPLTLALAAVLLLWAILFFTTRYVSVASIGAAAGLPVAVWGLVSLGWAGWTLFWFSVVVAALAVWRHRTNIQRLLNGTESRFTPKKKA